MAIYFDFCSPITAFIGPCRQICFLCGTLHSADGFSRPRYESEWSTDTYWRQVVLYIARFSCMLRMTKEKNSRLLRFALRCAKMCGMEKYLWTRALRRSGRADSLDGQVRQRYIHYTRAVLFTYEDSDFAFTYDTAYVSRCLCYWPAVRCAMTTRWAMIWPAGGFWVD